MSYIIQSLWQYLDVLMNLLGLTISVYALCGYHSIKSYPNKVETPHRYLTIDLFVNVIHFAIEIAGPKLAASFDAVMARSEIAGQL